MAESTETPAVAASQSVNNENKEVNVDAPAGKNNSEEKSDKNDSHAERKRKRFGDEAAPKFGRGGKRRDMGRKEWQYVAPIAPTSTLKLL